MRTATRTIGGHALTKRVGRAIRRQRRLLGWSQGDLAEALRVTDRTIVSRWELGMTFPTPDHLAALGDAMGVDVARLFEREDENGWTTAR